MRDLSAPQLNFTPESLARRRAWGARPTLWGVLSPSQYHQARGSRLAELRDRILTSGVTYDIHFLVTPEYAPQVPHLYPLGPSGLRTHVQVEVVVVTNVYDEPVAPADPVVANFYGALKREWRCVAEFRAGRTRSGLTLWVYASPEFSERVGLPAVCNPQWELAVAPQVVDVARVRER